MIRNISNNIPPLFYVSLKRFSTIVFFLTIFFPNPAFAIQETGDFDIPEEAWFYDDMASIASLTSKPISKTPGIVTVITSELIESMGARLLTDVLKIIPGFDLSYNNFGEYFLAIRGIDKQSNILFLINGLRFNDFCSGSALYDMPVDNIKRIEILRGPGSVLYGTNAMVGVINIITKTETGIKGKIGGGNFQTYKGNALFGDFIGNIELYGFAEFYKTNGGDAEIEEDFASQKQQSLTPTNIIDDKEKKEGHLAAKSRGYEAALHFYKEQRGPNVGVRRTLTEGTSVDSDYLSIDTKKTYELTKKINLIPSLHVDYWKWDYDIQLYKPGYTVNNEVFPIGPWKKKSYETLTYGGDIGLQFTSSDTHQLQTGITIEQASLDNTSIETNYLETIVTSSTSTKINNEYDGQVALRPFFGNWNDKKFPEESRTITGFFIQDDWQPVHFLNFVGGFRCDRYSDFGDTFNPRLALIFFPTTDLDIKFQYATAYRAPTFRELYDETDIEFVGNPELRPEKIQTLEVGIGIQFLEKSFIRINVYRNNIADSIGVKPGEVTILDPRSFENLQGQDIYGGEIEARYNYSGNSFLYGNGSLFQAKDLESDTWLTRIPQFRANIGWNQKLPWNGNFNLFFIFGDKRATNFLDRNAQSPEKPWDNQPINIQKSSPYRLFNISISKKNFFDMKAGIKFSVFNLLNTDYREIMQDRRFRLSTGVNGDDPRLPSNQRSYFVELFKEF